MDTSVEIYLSGFEEEESGPPLQAGLMLMYDDTNNGGFGWMRAAGIRQRMETFEESLHSILNFVNSEARLVFDYTMSEFFIICLFLQM